MQRAAACVAPGSCNVRVALTEARRGWAFFQFSNFHGWTIPYGGKRTNITKEELQNFRYFNTKSREQWDYNRIDESVTQRSEFRDTSSRPTFETGQRPDNSFVNDYHPHTPKKYSLHDYFDEYTKPGVNKKVAACYAVKENWDADEFYYPGESWQKNRPGFRSVPKEILNRDTWYHWSDVFTKVGDLQATLRTRSWNPQWPPPGYKMPKMSCKKEFIFGAEDPSVVTEIERYYWYRSWMDNNMRVGFQELFLFVNLAVVLYYYARSGNSNMVRRSMFSNLYYPGANFLRPFGVPRDWENEYFWWQEPLDTFPNQGEVYYMDKMRFGYMRHLEQRDAREALEAQL